MTSALSQKKCQKIVVRSCYCIPGPHHILKPEGVAVLFSSHVINIQEDDQPSGFYFDIPQRQWCRDGESCTQQICCQQSARMSKLYLTPNQVKDCISTFKGTSLGKYGHRLLIRKTTVFSLAHSYYSDFPSILRCINQWLFSHSVGKLKTFFSETCSLSYLI